MIIYHDNKNDISTDQLKGFFVGWKKPLTAEQHCKVLYGSTYFIVAVDDETNEAIGYITALSDGVNSAFIPVYISMRCCIIKDLSRCWKRRQSSRCGLHL